MLQFNEAHNNIDIDTGHGAIGSFAGFHYQYYFYILRMLKMQNRDEKVGFEYRDDVDSETEGRLTYYQLKHTVNHSLEPKLTLCDPDLWKALKVWVDVVDKQKNKGVDINQYLSNIDFVLVTNKKEEDNDFCKKVSQYKAKQIDFATIKQYMQKLHDARKDPEQKEGEQPKVNKVKSYMHDILQSEELDIILNHVDFMFYTDDNLLDEIKFQVRLRGVPEDRIDEATESLLGKVGLELFPKIQNGEDVTMTVIEFGNLILRVLGQYRGAKFIAKRRIPFDVTEDLSERIFIKQLIAVKDIDPEEMDIIVDYTQQMIDYVQSELATRNANGLSPEDWDNLYDDALRFWRQKFRLHYKTINKECEDEVIKSATKLLDDIRSEYTLKIGDENMDTYHRIGLYYNLSDQYDNGQPKIGWHYNWEQMFRKS